MQITLKYISNKPRTTSIPVGVNKVSQGFDRISTGNLVRVMKFVYRCSYLPNSTMFSKMLYIIPRTTSICNTSMFLYTESQNYFILLPLVIKQYCHKPSSILISAQQYRNQAIYSYELIPPDLFSEQPYQKCGCRPLLMSCKNLAVRINIVSITTESTSIMLISIHLYYIQFYSCTYSRSRFL